LRAKKLLAAATGVLATALALSACTPTPQATQTSLNTESVATVAWNQAFYSYNNATSFGNATANTNIIYLTNDSFSYYDKDLKIQPNKSFGTYEKVSDSPLTVKQTIADTATWSDGVPVTPADLILAYGAQSGLYNNYEAKVDPESGDVSKDNVGTKVFFNSSNPGWALIKKFPTIDGKTITYEYSKPFVDWELPGSLFNPGVAAHVVGKVALGIDDPTQAAQAVLDAFQKKDNAALSKISNVWNSKFNFEAMPSDTSLVVGTGPYTITALTSDYVTMKKNPNYKGEHTPSIDTITVRIIGDAQASVQALQNGEVLATQPQATADILKQMQALQGVTVLNGVGGTFEHVDMAQNNKGPFDPAAYGGDANKANLVRDAWLQTIPRQKIIDTIIKPLNPDAEIRNSLIVVPGSPMYDGVVAASGMATKYGAGDNTDKAKQLLQQAGVTSPTVRFMYDNTNTRRVQEFQLIKESAEKAGFKVVDAGNKNWGSLLGNTAKYDSVLFGWQSVSTGLSESDANFRTKGQNNFYGYSNKKVDGLLDQIQVATDAAKQQELVNQVETQLVADNFSISIFQFPEPTGVSNKLQNVSSMSLSPTMFWNFWQWKLG
jgi:peptide/nickel transport system substrate-binding protein